MAVPNHVFAGARRLMSRSREDDVAGLAAEIGYRSFLELFPFFVFLAAIGGLLERWLHVQNPARQFLDMVEQSLPQGAADPIRQQLEAVLGAQPQGFIGLPILGILWLAAGSGAALLKAMNRIYDIEETRPFWERYLVGLWLTVLGGAVLVIAVFIMGAGQLLGQQTDGGSTPDQGWFGSITTAARLPAVLLILLVEAGVVFRVAPNAKPPWRFITPGALLFGIGWLAASALFVLYVDRAGGYTGTYGVLGGVVVLLLWLQLTAYALLLGAELNGLLEHPVHGAQPSQAERAYPASDAKRAESGRSPAPLSN